MAETSNPPIANTEVVFSGSSGAVYNNANLVDWTVNTGTLYYFGSSRITSDNNPTHRRWAHATAQPTSADYGIYMQATAASVPTADMDIWVRASAAATTGYRAKVNADGTWSVTKYENGSLTATIDNGDLGSLAPSTSHTFEFYASGSTPTTLRLYVDGTQIGGDLTDNTGPITAQGYALYGFTTSGHWQASKLQLRTEGASALSVSPLPSSEAITVGNAPTLDLTSFVSGGTAPYTYTVAAGSTDTLPTGLTLNTDGSWSGTCTTDAESKAVTFNVEDSAGSPANVDTSEITFNVSAVSNTAPAWVGAPGTGDDIPDFTLVEGVAHAGLDISAYWEDPGDTFTVSADVAYQAWPAGVTIVNGVITIAEGTITAGGPTTVRAEAIDSVTNATKSNTFTITVSAAAASVTTSALHNGAGTVLASTAVNWVWFPTGIAEAIAAGTTVAGTADSTNAGGVLVTSATLPAGAGYLFVYTASYAKVYLEALTAA